MAPAEKPSRLGRGLDALLARRESAKPADSSVGGAVPNQPPQTPSAPSTAAEIREQPTANADAARAPTASPFKTSDAGTTATSTAIPASAATSRAVPVSGSALMDNGAVTANSQTSAYRVLPIAHIAPNSFQPRKEFHAQDLADLESSLRSQGLLQPITVRPSPNHTGYELIAGERRLRAATRLGWKEIPAIVRETDDRAMLTLAMVENLQRADLDPIEEADGYQRLIDDFAATQQEVAEVVGKERSTVANALRLLALPASVKRMLQERKLSVGHARALLPLETERAMSDLARDIIAKTLSVRDVEQRVRGSRPSPAKSGRKAKPANTGVAPSTPAAGAEMRRVEELLRKKMQTTVTLHLTGKERGEVRISFLSNDDLERVLDLLGVNLDS
ncbi:MAG: ParB/RepB/Spo0J family partition protein [Gemmatimonadaceae bacterium]